MTQDGEHRGGLRIRLGACSAPSGGRIQRRRSRGADAKQAAPNLVLLNNALAQTGWTSSPLSETTWRAAVRRRLGAVRWDLLKADVGPLLETPDDRALLTRETITSLLDQRRPLAPTSASRPKRRGRRRVE